MRWGGRQHGLGAVAVAISRLSDTIAQEHRLVSRSAWPFPRRASTPEGAARGDRTFQQAAGFLRIMNGDTRSTRRRCTPRPTLSSSASSEGRHAGARADRGHETLRSLRPEDFADTQFGTPTVRDILRSWRSRDAIHGRSSATATFKEGVPGDRRPAAGMILEGVVTNVANLCGVRRRRRPPDGLVHISQLATSSCKDPRDVVKAGRIVKVKVVEVDLKRRRIAFDDEAAGRAASGQAARRSAGEPRAISPAAARQPTSAGAAQGAVQAPSTAMAAAFSKLRR
jgi:uncharacterized protein